jgi:enoyl-CoA hydratase
MGNAFEAAWTCFAVTREGRVARIRLNRPEALNSMNRAFWNELPAIVRDIDDNARAIVISYTGKHFSAGCCQSKVSSSPVGRLCLNLA